MQLEIARNKNHADGLYTEASDWLHMCSEKPLQVGTKQPPKTGQIDFRFTLQIGTLPPRPAGILINFKGKLTKIPAGRSAPICSVNLKSMWPVFKNCLAPS